jgi:uncharacterized coiled-coil protein SlyX
VPWILDCIAKEAESLRAQFLEQNDSRFNAAKQWKTAVDELRAQLTENDVMLEKYHRLMYALTQEMGRNVNCRLTGSGDLFFLYVEACNIATSPQTTKDVIAKVRNEALEEAAKACGRRVSDPDLHDDADIINAMNNEAIECAREIRALKTEETNE